MAKRTRGSNRPGQRHSGGHGGKPQTSSPRSSSVLSSSEEARAAELESQIVAQERAAEAGRARDRSRAGEVSRPGRPGGQGLLAARAAEEYGYVVRDVRRILIVGGAMAAALAVLYVLIDIAHVVTIS